MKGFSPEHGWLKQETQNKPSDPQTKEGMKVGSGAY